jgi:ferritin-like metal-binding protein YciE
MPQKSEKNLHDGFLDEIRDTYDCERQLTRALPKMAKAATGSKLRNALNNHLKETQAQVERLEHVFDLLEERPRGKHCKGIAGIIEEGSDLIEEGFDEPAMDAALIGAAQRAEHYEIAAYGTLVAWAVQLGHMEVADLLRETLEEEKGADEQLTIIARDQVNEEAAARADEEANEEQIEEPVSKAAPKAKKARARR